MEHTCVIAVSPFNKKEGVNTRPQKWEISWVESVALRDPFDPTLMRLATTVSKVTYKLATKPNDVPVYAIAKLVTKSDAEIDVHAHIMYRVPLHVPGLLARCVITPAEADALFPQRASDKKRRETLYLVLMEYVPRSLQNDLTELLGTAANVKALFEQLYIPLQAMAAGSWTKGLHDDPYPRNVLATAENPPRFLLTDFGKMTSGTVTSEQIDAWIDTFLRSLARMIEGRCTYATRTKTSIPFAWLADVPAVSSSAVVARINAIREDRYTPAKVTPVVRDAGTSSSGAKRRIVLTPQPDTTVSFDDTSDHVEGLIERVNRLFIGA